MHETVAAFLSQFRIDAFRAIAMQGDWDFERTAKRHVLGPEHPETLSTMNNTRLHPFSIRKPVAHPGDCSYRNQQQ
jgi:hypothetical protein